jgi:hypothetical protein
MTNQPTIVFADPGNAVMPSAAIIHGNDTFQVQWTAQNTSQGTSTAFTDLIVITSIPEGCPGSKTVSISPSTWTDQLPKHTHFCGPIRAALRLGVIVRKCPPK